MNIKQTFLNLTEYTIPHGNEHLLEKYLPDNVKKDNFGNYFIIIGKSETLFTCHLDTYSKQVQKVNHIIEGDIVKTDGKTILGGDNKTGVCILLYMIENNVPGTYYFFAGEEPTAKDGGLYGSKNALKANPKFFKNFKRAVCFDRKKTGSIVTRQMARFTCSQNFIDALILELDKQGLEFHSDITGYYTDTAVFLDTISEVTNLSSGVYGEHTLNEYVDLSYVEKMAEAAIKINWESLPAERIPKKESSKIEGGTKSIFKFSNYLKIRSDRKIFSQILNIMDDLNYLCLNEDEFESGVNMIFSQWHEDKRVLISIDGGVIFINSKKIGNITDFEDMVGIDFESKVDIQEFLEEIDDLVDELETDNININIFKKRILKKFNVTIQEFEKCYYSKDCKFKTHIKYRPNEKIIVF